MVPNYPFLLFSAALTIRPCTIISLEPAVPGHMYVGPDSALTYTYVGQDSKG